MAAKRDTTPPAAPPVADTAAAFDFEQALEDLEALVERLEQGDLPLEASLAEFQRGIELSRRCQVALGQAEQRVEQLLKSADGSESRVPFADGDGEP